MKPPLIRTLSLAVFLLVGTLSHSITWEFSLSRHFISSALPFPSQGEFPPAILHEVWTLSLEGGQSYVFISQDGTHVLKFFKDQPRPWLKCPSYQTLKNKKLYRTLSGYALLQERCPNLSATLLLHFSPSASPLPATLVDRLGISHSIDLKSYLFVLQKKVEPLTLSSHEKEKITSEVSSLLQQLAQAHLQDHDPRLHLNLGRLGDHLVLLDPGRLVNSPDPSPQIPEKFLEFFK